MKKRILTLLFALFFALPLCACTAPQNGNEGGDPPEDGPVETVDPEPEYVEGHEVISREEINRFQADAVRLYGRTYYIGRYLILGNAATGFEVLFYGTGLEADLDIGNRVDCKIFVDGGEGTRYAVKSSRTHTLAENLEEGVHTVRVVKATSSQNGNLVVKSLKTDGKFLRPEQETKKSIEFVGDSITVGAGILATPAEACADKNTDATQAYAYRTAQALGYDCSVVATEGICTKAAPFALPFSMMEMYRQLSSTNTNLYTFPKQHDVVVVALGTNDAFYLGSHSDYAESYPADYAELLTLIRSKNENAHIVCVYGMMGTNQTIENGIKQAIASMQDDKISYCPLPAGQNGGEGHPSLDDAAKQSEVLTDYLKTLLGE